MNQTPRRIGAAFLDSDGKPLINSNRPNKSVRPGTTNIGFPSTQDGVDHFTTMLRQTAPRMTPEKIDELKNVLIKK